MARLRNSVNPPAEETDSYAEKLRGMGANVDEIQYVPESEAERRNREIENTLNFIPDPFEKGFASSVYGMEAGSLARRADEEEARGRVGRAQSLRDQAFRRAREAEVIAPATDFTAIDSIGSLYESVTGAAGSGVASFLPTLAAGAVGSLAGPIGAAVAAGTVGYNLMQNEAAMSMAADPRIMAQKTAQERLREQNIYAAMAAPLEAIPGVALAPLSKALKVARGSRARRGAIGFGIEGTGEGITEASQGALLDARLEAFDPEGGERGDVRDRVNEFFAGFFGGGLPGGVVGAMGKGREGVEGDIKKREDKIKDLRAREKEILEGTPQSDAQDARTELNFVDIKEGLTDPVRQREILTQAGIENVDRLSDEDTGAVYGLVVEQAKYLQRGETTAEPAIEQVDQEELNITQKTLDTIQREREQDAKQIDTSELEKQDYENVSVTLTPELRNSIAQEQDPDKAREILRGSKLLSDTVQDEALDEFVKAIKGEPFDSQKMSFEEFVNFIEEQNNEYLNSISKGTPDARDVALSENDKSVGAGFQDETANSFQGQYKPIQNVFLADTDPQNRTNELRATEVQRLVDEGLVDNPNDPNQIGEVNLYDLVTGGTLDKQDLVEVIERSRVNATKSLTDTQGKEQKELAKVEKLAKSPADRKRLLDIKEESKDLTLADLIARKREANTDLEKSAYETLILRRQGEAYKQIVDTLGETYGKQADPEIERVRSKLENIKTTPAARGQITRLEKQNLSVAQLKEGLRNANSAASKTAYQVLLGRRKLANLESKAAKDTREPSIDPNKLLDVAKKLTAFQPTRRPAGTRVGQSFMDRLNYTVKSLKSQIALTKKNPTDDNKKTLERRQRVMDLSGIELVRKDGTSFITTLNDVLGAQRDAGGNVNRGNTQEDIQSIVLDGLSSLLTERSDIVAIRPHSAMNRAENAAYYVDGETDSRIRIPLDAAALQNKKEKQSAASRALEWMEIQGKRLRKAPGKAYKANRAILAALNDYNVNEKTVSEAEQASIIEANETLAPEDKETLGQRVPELGEIAPQRREELINLLMNNYVSRMLRIRNRDEAESLVRAFEAIMDNQKPDTDQNKDPFTFAGYLRSVTGGTVTNSKGQQEIIPFLDSKSITDEQSDTRSHYSEEHDDAEAAAWEEYNKQEERMLEEAKRLKTKSKDRGLSVPANPQMKETEQTVEDAVAKIESRKVLATVEQKFTAAISKASPVMAEALRLARIRFKAETAGLDLTKKSANRIWDYYYSRARDLAETVKKRKSSGPTSNTLTSDQIKALRDADRAESRQSSTQALLKRIGLIVGRQGGNKNRLSSKEAIKKMVEGLKKEPPEKRAPKKPTAEKAKPLSAQQKENIRRAYEESQRQLERWNREYRDNLDALDEKVTEAKSTEQAKKVLTEGLSDIRESGIEESYKTLLALSEFLKAKTTKDYRALLQSVGSDLSAAVAIVFANTNNPIQRQVIASFYYHYNHTNLIPDTSFILEGGQLGGSYDFVNDTLTLKMFSLSRKQDKDAFIQARYRDEVSHTMAHELAHILTMASIVRNPEYAAELQNLLDQTKKAFAEKGLSAQSSGTRDTTYGLTNIFEFAAEAFSNPSFQEALASISYKTETKAESTTLWGRFVNLVRKALNLKNVDNSVLDGFFAVSSQYGPVYPGDRVTQNGETVSVKRVTGYKAKPVPSTHRFENREEFIEAVFSQRIEGSLNLPEMSSAVYTNVFPGSKNSFIAFQGYMKSLKQGDAASRRLHKVLRNVGRSPVVRRQVETHLDTMVKMGTMTTKKREWYANYIKKPENLTAIAYQFWNNGVSLRVGSDTRTAFEKIRDRALELMKQISQMDKADMIFEAVRNDKLNQSTEISQFLRQHRVESFSQKFEQMMPIFKKVAEGMLAARDRLRVFGLDELDDLADRFKPENGKIIKLVKGRQKTTNLGMLDARQKAYAKFKERLATIGDKFPNIKFTPELMREFYLEQDTDNEFVNEVRDLLKDVRDYMIEGDASFIASNGKEVKPKWRKNYFPRLWKRDGMSDADREQLAKLLVEESGKDGRQALTQEQAAEIADKLTRPHSSLLRKPSESLRSSLMNRKIEFIDETNIEKFLPFLEDDFVHSLDVYLFQATTHTEFGRYFGNDGALIKEAKSKVADRLTADEKISMDNSIAALTNTMREDYPEWAHRWTDRIITYQNLRVLELAVFSMLVDPMAVAVRTGDLGAAWRTLMSNIKGAYKNADNEQLAELARSIGVLERSGHVFANAALYSGVAQSKGTTKVNNFFFELTQINEWNRRSRFSALMQAELFLQKRKGSKRHMKELGLTEALINKMKYDDKTDSFEMEVDDQGHFKRFKGLNKTESKKVEDALLRLVDEMILRPDPSNKPVFMSDPLFAIPSHLMQFTWQFQRVIINRAFKEVKEGDYIPATALLGFIPAMLVADTLKKIMMLDWLGDDEPEWELVDAMESALIRSGVMGVGTYGYEFVRDSYERGLGEAVIGLPGPAIEQSVDLIGLLSGDPRKDPMREFINGVPFASVADRALNLSD